MIVTGKKYDWKFYRRHSGRPGGMKLETSRLELQQSVVFQFGRPPDTAPICADSAAIQLPMAVRVCCLVGMEVTGRMDDERQRYLLSWDIMWWSGVVALVAVCAVKPVCGLGCIYYVVCKSNIQDISKHYLLLLSP